MKSCSAYVAGKRRDVRLTALSLLTGMVLLFSSGLAVAADYYHQLPSAAKWVKAEKATDAEKTNFVKWLATEPSAENTMQFVTSTLYEQVKFSDGIRAAYLKKFEESNDAAATFKTDLTKALTDLNVAAFGGSSRRRQALLDLANKILSMSKEELERATWLDEALRGLLVDLDLRTDNPDERPTTPPTPPTPPTTTTTPPPPPSVPTGKDDAKTKALEDALAGIAKRVDALGEPKTPVNPTVTTPPVPPATTTAPPTPPRVGEQSQDDAVLRRQAQEVCDKFNALQKAQQDGLAAQLNPLKDALNETFNQIAALQRFNPNQQNQQKNRLEDVLPGLLADALKKDNNNQITPPQAPVASAARPQRNDRDNNNNDLPLPPQKEQPEQPQPQQPFIPSFASNSQPRPISLNLPSSNGRFQLRAAEERAALNEMRTPVAQTLTANAGLPELVMAKVKVQTDLRATQSELQTTKDQAARIDEQVEELKEGGRAALPDWVKREEARLKQELESKKRNFEQTKQMAQAASQNPDQAQQVQGMLQAQAQEVNQAEQAKNQFDAEVEMKIEEGNKAIKSLAKQRDRLQSAASKLEGQLGSLKEEEQAVSTLINQNMQMQLAAIQNQGQPQAAGTANVNKLLGFGGGSGGPRTGVPSRFGGAATSKPASGKPATGGGVMRPSLSSVGSGN